MKKKTKKSSKIIKLYQQLLEVNSELSEIAYLYQQQENLLKEIFKENKGPQIIEVEGEERTLEVVPQNGQYIFHKPLRLSNKKAA
tara:strand:- start:48 stop:302 length:255 start_codon:yes stop_codon:yes gene_type:complete